MGDPGMTGGRQGASLPTKSEELPLKPVTSVLFIRCLLANNSTVTDTIDLRTRTLPVQTKARVYVKDHQSQLRYPLLRRRHQTVEETVDVVQELKERCKVCPSPI